ncbi:hypothetical protein CLV30_106168 [Haloactinopolyspora alba]|uniref:Uncharacterized protein n=2 Tax=Haloactinopolyspora alba TaxID=648780 RepID=A0A2P8E3X1_9ACTN|nr:hypothetical protein CLV30_106168 [Haloactinopolyspora alba]
MLNNWETESDPRAELAELPERVGRQVARRFKGADWEDLRQDAWIWLLERPEMVEEYLEKHGENALGYIERNMRRFLTERRGAEAERTFNTTSIENEMEAGRL